MNFKLTLITVLFLVVGCKTSKVSTIKLVEHTNNNIVYEGRIGENETKTASEIYWSGSSIKINFEGTQIKAILEDENGANYFNVIIDGSKFETLKLNKGKNTYVLATNLTNGKHSVELTKRNEWTYGKTLFYGFEIDGKIASPDPKKQLFIEFYGDSITAGHGNEDTSENDSPTGDVTNNYTTYAAITARHFNAEYSCIARGGIGIMVSWYNMIMPEMYDRLNPDDENSKWNFTAKQPDIVVVNVFQNDSWIVNRPNHEEFIRRFGTEKPSEEKTIKAYKSFVEKIRAKYPKASIVCMLGNMDITKEGSPWPGYVKEAVQQLNDPKIVTTFAPYKNSKKHPSVSEQQLIADELIQTIQDKIINN